MSHLVHHQLCTSRSSLKSLALLLEHQTGENERRHALRTLSTMKQEIREMQDKLLSQLLSSTEPSTTGGPTVSVRWRNRSTSLQHGSLTPETPSTVVPLGTHTILLFTPSTTTTGLIRSCGPSSTLTQEGLDRTQ